MTAAVAAAIACSPNPLLGDWEMDTQKTGIGAAAHARQVGFDRISFGPQLVTSGGVELDVDYVMEGDRVRVVRRDRDHEDVVELLEDERIRVHFPSGIAVVYRRAS